MSRRAEALYRDMTIASRAMSLAVLSSADTGIGVSGSLDAPAEVVADDSVDAAWSLLNEGNAAIDPLTAKVELVDTATGEVVREEPLSASLALDAPAQGSVRFSTQGLPQPSDAGTSYELRLVASFPARTRTLATRALLVKSGIILDVSKETTTVPRVLVWAETDAESAVASRALDGLEAFSRRVRTEEQFVAEMRTGVWNTYVIMDASKPLTAHLDEELAEKVFSGATVIASRWSGLDDFKQTDVFGAKVEGVLPPAARTMALSETSATVAGVLPVTGKVQRLAASGAQGLASFGGRPVVTLNRYGRGTAIAYAFDLATAPAAQGAATLRAAVQRVSANTDDCDASDVTAVAVTVTNRGNPATVRVVESVSGGTIVAALGAPTQASPLTWQRTLAQGETARIVYLVRLPDQGPLVATSTVSYALGGTTQSYGTYALTLEASTTLSALQDRALAETKAIVTSSKADEQRRQRAADALSQLKQAPPTSKPQYESAIDRLVKATEEIDAMEADVTKARLAVDALLAYYESRWSL